MEFIPEPYCSTKYALNAVYRSIYPEPSRDESLKQSVGGFIVKMRDEAERIVDDLPNPPPSLAKHTTLVHHLHMSPEEKALSRRLDKMAEALRLEQWLNAVCDSRVFFDPIAFLETKLGDGLGVVQGYANADETQRPPIISTIPHCLSLFGVERRNQVEQRFREKLCAASVLAYYPNSHRGMVQFLNENFWIDDKKAEDALRRGSATHGSGYNEVKLRFDKRQIQAQFPPTTAPNDNVNNLLRRNVHAPSQNADITPDRFSPIQEKEDVHFTTDTSERAGDGKLPRLSTAELEAAWLEYVAEYSHPNRPNRNARRAKYRNLSITVQRGDALHKKLSPEYWKKTNNKQPIDN